MNTSSASQNIIFVHIPRTGGTSFKYILTRALAKKSQYKLKQWIPFPETLYKSNFTLVHGHMNWPIPHKTKATIISIVRDPVDRIISLYKYLCLQSLDRFSPTDINNFDKIPDLRDLQLNFSFSKHAPVLHKFIFQKPSIIEFCDFWRPTVINQQTKIIAGVYFDGGETLYKDDNDLYQRALRNIEASDCIIGNTANLGKLVEYCSNKFNFSYNKIADINKTSLKLNIAASVRNEIMKLNLYDKYLYDHCEKLFDKKFSKFKNND
jgi:hypothetical protein